MALTLATCVAMPPLFSSSPPEGAFRGALGLLLGVAGLFGLLSALVFVGGEWKAWYARRPRLCVLLAILIAGGLSFLFAVSAGRIRQLEKDARREESARAATTVKSGKTGKSVVTAEPKGR
jgi:hypothetical protein